MPVSLSKILTCSLKKEFITNVLRYSYANGKSTDK